MDPSLASAAPLTLPPATLHFPLSPHPDSDEHLQKDKHRTARELEPLSPSQIPQAASSPSHNAEQRSPNIPLRPPYTYPTYPRNSLGSPFLRARAQRRQSGSITTASDDEWEAAATQNRLRRQTPHWYDGIVKWWNTQICVTIDEGQHRDHLALERTFLAYLRTSLAMAMTGVLIAQLFRLQHALHPSPTLGFFVLGIPLAVTFIACGAFILLLGAFRFWRQQNAIVRGKVFAGGWEITTIMVVIIVLSMALFAFVVAIDIEKE